MQQLPNRFEVQFDLPSTPVVIDYRFEENIETIVGRNKEHKTTTRTIQICCSGIEDNLHRFQLLCLDLDLKSNYLGTASTSILRKQLNIFDEVILYANHKGSIIKIINLEDIRDRWKEVKNELMEEHQGAAFEEFLSDTDDFLQNETDIKKFIQSKEMYGLYFNDCWGIHHLHEPRFEGLEIMLKEPNRKEYDRHSKDIIKGYNNDSSIIWNISTDNKTQECVILYKDNQLEEAYLEIKQTNSKSNYSLCLMS